jgi:hypothetical protein
MVKVLVASLLIGVLCPVLTVKAQTTISESRRLIFFNSPDSAQGATIARDILLVNYWLDHYDPHNSFSILLDLRPRTDTAFWELGHDNLFGNSLSYTDPSAIPFDPGEQLCYKRVSLRIRGVGPTADPKCLLQLLEYGIAHFATLKQMHALCLSDGPDSGKETGPVTLVPQDIASIISRPSSSKVRYARKKCFAQHSSVTIYFHLPIFTR